MNSRSSFVFALPLATMFAIAGAAHLPAFGQERQAQEPQSITVGGVEIKGLPDDWTHHHLVFSSPGMEHEALANGTYDRWLSVVNNPRYIIQQLKRHAAAHGPAAADVARIQEATKPDGLTPMLQLGGGGDGGGGGDRRHQQKVHKDWSVGMDGAAATATGTVGTLNSSNISGSSTLTIGSVTLDASPPTAASETGTFTGNPTNGQTATIGGSVVLTASLSTAATGSISVASSFCFKAGQGVTINGTSLTTNATQGTGSVTINSTPDSGDTVTIGSTTYTFVTSSPGTNQVQISGTSTSATNLHDAINGTCSGTDCGTGTTANTAVSAGTPSGGSIPLTALCADNSTVSISDTASTRISESNVTAGNAGSNTSTTFALNSSGDTPASQTATAANIITTVNANATTKAIVTASSGGTGVVSLSANTWGTAGNAYTLAQNAASGVSVSGTTLAGGTNGTNTGTSFAIDNVLADNATNLAAAITRNGSTVGVTASASGAVVTVTAATPGTGGNSIALAEGLTNFSWSGSELSNGSDGTTSGTTFAYWSVNNYVSSSVLATNIATAINDNSTLEGTTGVFANSSSNVVTIDARTNGTSGNSIALSKASFSGYTWSGSDLSGGAVGTGKVQPNTYPAKYGVSLFGASCSDFAIYPTGQAGATGVASIVAYYNLYTTGCSGAVPSVYWAYNTGGTVTTSPVLSLDGSQVAFIQVSGSTASLVLLKWAAGPPMTLTSQSSGSAYRSCTAPCMYVLPFADGNNDTFSAPFYDYGDNYADVLFVGDDSGKLHEFTGVFLGSPAEAGNPWPVSLGSYKLSSPVYDCSCGFQAGYVFVGDYGGIFYGVGTGYGGTTAGQVHGNTGPLGDAIADAPLVDSSEGTEFVFVTTNGSYSYTGDNGVWEFVSIFTDLGTPGVVPVGTGGTGYYLYAGEFDNVYFDSGNPAYGHLYVAGNTGSTGGGTLYQVDIAYSSLTGTVNSVVTGLNNSEHPWPSPLTEFCNNGQNNCTITSQRSVTAKVSKTSPELTILDGSGTFTSADVGAYVSGTDITFGTTISSVLSTTTANLSAAPTANVSSESVAIQGGQTTSGTDYVFFSVNRGTPSGCTNTAGNGCILSYNVNNPTAVSLSGSGLNVTTPVAPGCWATGGFVIDNSDNLTTGAQQIYFVNLNGASAGGPSGNTSANCTTDNTASLDATQASQANP